MATTATLDSSDGVQRPPDDRAADPGRGDGGRGVSMGNAVIMARAAANPPNRFERLAFEPVPEALEPDEAAPAPEAVYYRDGSRRIISRNASPDAGSDPSI